MKQSSYSRATLKETGEPSVITRGSSERLTSISGDTSSENHFLGYQHFPALSFVPDITATYTYDLYGRRLQKSVNGIATHFFWEDDNLAMEQPDLLFLRDFYDQGVMARCLLKCI